MRTFHPSQPSVGNNVSATLIRQLIAEIRASRVIAGPGVAVRRTPQGTHVSAKAVPPAVGGGSPRVFWTFEKKTYQQSGEPSHAWHNKILQIGMAFEDFDSPSSQSRFTDDTDGSDGMYFVEISLKANPISVAIRKGSFPAADPLGGKVYFRLGYVTDGKLDKPLPFVPVIYINL